MSVKYNMKRTAIDRLKSLIKELKVDTVITFRITADSRMGLANDIESLINKTEELEKMVDLMVEYIKDSGIYAEHCQIRIESDECDENNYNCEDCIKEYFKKKAKL